ncbi:hypothetical protein D3C73_760200 [compost metagenome]
MLNHCSIVPFSFPAPHINLYFPQSFTTTLFIGGVNFMHLVEHQELAIRRMAHITHTEYLSRLLACPATSRLICQFHAAKVELVCIILNIQNLKRANNGISVRCPAEWRNPSLISDFLSAVRISRDRL